MFSNRLNHNFSILPGISKVKTPPTPPSVPPKSASNSNSATGNKSTKPRNSTVTSEEEELMNTQVMGHFISVL